ncbi:hypothetical protein Tco_0902420 [Tanacetum coccineum]
MTDVDVNAPAELAPTMAPPTRTDDQILPHIRWVPIGKSNCYLDVDRSQSNPIFKIVVDLLKHTKFFRAITASSAIPTIYIQQFWDTIRYDKIARGYKCQLDEQWFDLSKYTHRDALQITPVDRNNAFSSPPTPDALIKFVNDLGYPKVVRHLSDVVTNDMFQPWRALTTIINLCLTGKTSGFERPRAPVLQILWGVINQAHIDYAERMWEEFTQSIHTFIEDKKNLAQHTQYVVPTGRVVVPTGRYVVPAGKVIIIVSPGRLSLVPTGRVLSPGSDNESDDASVHSEATIAQQQQNIQPQIITTVSNNNAKFPYLKKDEYEVWAMKMEYWITNNDMNIWKVIQNGNSLKRTGRDRDGRVIILPPTTADEHIAVQRESKARTTLLQSIPDDHVADFHYMDDARDIWNAVKARFGGNAESKKMRKSMLKQEFSEFRISEAEGLHKGYDRMQKILSQLNQLKAKPEDEDINLKFLRALPSSWSQVALTLKTKGGLELLSFDDLYYKLKTLEVDIKGYSTFSSSQSAGPSHSAFVSTTSASKKMSYADSPSYSSSTYTAPSNSKTGSHRSGNVIEDVLQSFVADTEPEQQLAYEDFEQIEKMDLEEMDLKWQMAMLSVRVHKFEQKAGRKIDFDKKESARFNKKKVRCYKCLQRVEGVSREASLESRVMRECYIGKGAWLEVEFVDTLWWNELVDVSVYKHHQVIMSAVIVYLVGRKMVGGFSCDDSLRGDWAVSYRHFDKPLRFEVKLCMGKTPLENKTVECGDYVEDEDLFLLGR